MHKAIAVPSAGRSFVPLLSALKPEASSRPAVERIAVDVDEAAAMLCISPKTAARLVKSGAIPSFPVGRLRRVRVAAIKEFCERQEAAATEKSTDPTLGQ
ncbi:MAG: helix-turn-helix domain-containing protein [Pirellulales bacterium]